VAATHAWLLLMRGAVAIPVVFVVK